MEFDPQPRVKEEPELPEITVRLEDEPLTEPFLSSCPDKPHACGVCGKSFSVQSSFLFHMRTHTGEKPHRCQVCGKSFTKQSYLLGHMRTHTGEKPHACATCGQSFSDKGNLLRHVRIHTGEKPYSCATCGKSFRQPSSLSCHRRAGVLFLKPTHTRSAAPRRGARLRSGDPS
uniref:C2H2-type domain-containing protein n=1 Tax=Salarias fasciatus TaxID=181472 RepID=A0A672HS13_SALFA